MINGGKLNCYFHVKHMYWTSWVGGSISCRSNSGEMLPEVTGILPELGTRWYTRFFFLLHLFLIFQYEHIQVYFVPSEFLRMACIFLEYRKVNKKSSQISAITFCKGPLWVCACFLLLSCYNLEVAEGGSFFFAFSCVHPCQAFKL